MQERTDVLCKYYGTLVLIEVRKSEDKGKCPICGCQEFREGSFGWTECDNPDGCSFAILTEHVKEIENRNFCLTDFRD